MVKRLPEQNTKETVLLISKVLRVWKRRITSKRLLLRTAEILLDQSKLLQSKAN